MADETYTFEAAKVRLEEIAAQVRKKDTSLERSLDLLEEGVRLANQCTEQIDHTQWRAAVDVVDDEDAEEPAEDSADDDAQPVAGEPAPVEEGAGAQDVEAFSQE
jgi:exodeoxyribonuclease VII small subunit